MIRTIPIGQVRAVRFIGSPMSGCTIARIIVNIGERIVAVAMGFVIMLRAWRRAQHVRVSGSHRGA